MNQPTRQDDTLTIYFPVPEFLQCPEAGCHKRYRSADWTTTRRSVSRHLETIHHIRVRHTFNYCTRCGSDLGRRPTLHACLIPPPPHPDIEMVDAAPLERCAICRAAFESKLGLRNHMASHTRDAQFIQHMGPNPTMTPRLRRAMRLAARRAARSPSPPSSSASSPPDQLSQHPSPGRGSPPSPASTTTSCTSPTSASSTTSLITVPSLNSPTSNEPEPNPNPFPNHSRDTPSPNSTVALPDQTSLIPTLSRPPSDHLLPNYSRDSPSPSSIISLPDPIPPHVPQPTSPQQAFPESATTSEAPSSPSWQHDLDLSSSSQSTVIPSPGDHGGDGEDRHRIDDEDEEDTAAGAEGLNGVQPGGCEIHVHLPAIEAISNRPQSAEAWQDFEELLEVIKADVRRLAKIPDRQPGEERRPHQPVDVTSHADIQKLYRRNRRRAVRLLLDGDSPHCNIERDLVAEKFRDTWAPKDCDTSIYVTVEGRECIRTTPLSYREVSRKLRGAESTAPGLDRITYQHWRNVDPKAVLITRLLNVCLAYKKIPACWKKTRTVLIHKKGDRENLDNWRPITLSDTMYKLYTGCLAKRMTDWMVKNNVLSASQKGFMPHDGVFEHNYVLESLMNNTKTSQAELCVAWLDYSNAFGSIPHSAISSSLECAGAGGEFCSIIRDMYEETTTIIAAPDGPTDPIPFMNGVKQGCPISGLLFNLAIDPVIRRVQDEHETPTILAYADDLTIIGSTPEELQERLKLVEDTSNTISISLNRTKCFSLHLSGRRPVGTRPTIFHLSSGDIQAIGDEEPATFLGRPVGYNIMPREADIETMMERGRIIMASHLAPWQRFDAMKSFYYPSLHFDLRSGKFSKTQWADIDRVMLPRFRRTLNLPDRSSPAYIYGSREAGACGIPRLSDDADIAKVDGAFKLLTSRDPAVISIAEKELRMTVEKRLRRPTSEEDTSRYMSGDNEGEFRLYHNHQSNTWTRARQASGRINVGWSFDVDNGLPNITMQEKTLDICKRQQVMKELRTILRKNWDTSLQALKSQGVVMECVAADRVSSHFMTSGEYTRFGDWRFIHPARLNLLPLKGAKPWLKTSGQDTNCRHCHVWIESTAHVLCHCMRYSRAMTRRHDSIVERYKTAARWQHTILAENQRVMAEHNLRPDLVITRSGVATIIDVTVPFDNRRDGLRAAREAKVRKYEPLRRAMLREFTEVTVEAVVVGALGSWDPDNDRLLKKICSKEYARLMKKLIVSDVIRWSRDIYVNFIAGHVPQNFPAPNDALADRNVEERTAVTAD